MLPPDPNNTYILHDIVPLDLPDRLQRARIVITNHHAFKARETMQAPKLVKGILGGHDGPIVTLETGGLMIQRVCKELLGGKRIKVLNDERITAAAPRLTPRRWTPKPAPRSRKTTTPPAHG